MERLESFEAMLADILKRFEYENQKMDELKRAGKEKSATYRQFMGNKLMYNKILSLYREYGLIE